MCLVLIAFLSAAMGTGFMFRHAANDALEAQAGKHLESVQSAKEEQLRTYFQSMQGQLLSFSTNPTVVDAMTDLPDALASDRADNPLSPEQLSEVQAKIEAFYGQNFSEEYERRNGVDATRSIDWFSAVDGDTAYLQHLYVTNWLTSSTVKGHGGNRGEDSSQYPMVHSKYDPSMRRFLNDVACHNILLCDPETGDVVYSVRKGPDFGTSLRHGPFKETNLGLAFRHAAAAIVPGEVYLVDFEPYTPSYEDVAGFMSTPIFYEGQKIGVAIFQLPVDRINNMIGDFKTYSKTGETYVVGADRLFRTDSRFLDELAVSTTIKNTNVVVDTVATRLALSGKTGCAVIHGYQGRPVLSRWSPLTFGLGEHERKRPLGWVIVTEIGLDEVLGEFHLTNAVRGTALLGGLMAIGALGLLVFLAYQISPSALSHRSQSPRRAGEPAEPRDELLACDGLAERPNRGDDYWDRALDYGRNSADQDSFHDQIQRISGDIQQSTLRVSTSACEIREITEELSKECDSQSGQIGDTSVAIRDMVESIGEVAENTSKSAQVAEEARETAANGSRAVLNTIDGMERIRYQVQETAKRIKRLGESSQEIGEIVQLISDVADRTSILALNASIQAAMAGDAGQGFAVVAEEVERLANRCNEATKQIARLVRGIQSETSDAVIGMEESIREVVEGSKLASQAGDALADIDSVSNRLAELINSISSAAKQQARGGLLMSRSIDEISSVMHETANGARKTASSVNRLTELAEHLRLSVNHLGGIENNASSSESDANARDVNEQTLGCSTTGVPLPDSVSPAR